MKTPSALAFLLVPFLLSCISLGQTLDSQLSLAGQNRTEIEKALEQVPASQKESMKFLVEHMPESDLGSLSAEFLLENVRLAHQARDASPWQISDGLFLNDVLPYANVDETREAWRSDLRIRAEKIVADCKTPGEAAQRLNEKLFKEVGVRYSTQRRRANQSPGESIAQGLASCTGLSILLVDACRSVNVPARLVGVPSWTTKRGNHTWVEVWDDGDWHFTGAAEYDANGLDHAWFVGDASKADKTSRRHSIYAASYQKTDTTFPMVWSRRGPRTFAVNVTDRYTQTKRDLSAEEIEVRIQVRAKDTGVRIIVPVRVCLAEDTSEQCAFGESRGESDDTNNMLTFQLKRGKKYKITIPDRLDGYLFTTENAAQQTIALEVEQQESNKESELTKSEANELAEQLYKQKIEELRKERKSEWDAKTIKLGELEMKFDYRTFGQQPEDGHSLFISMHGGGNAPARVNDRQWQNQIGLYEPKEGIYLAPRAPTNTWNLWHESHIDQFFARIIEDAHAIEGVNPNRVYIMGYSAGGDGVYQLAPRMADQLAAAAMMAGHPNGVSPLGLRNIGFTLHMGGKDGAYNRNKVAAEWKAELAKLKAFDPNGYDHEVVIHPEMGHWMQRKDAVAVEWMTQFTRNPLPEKVVWHQTGVPHSQYYWLAANPDDQVPDAKMVVSRNGNHFAIHETDKVSEVIIRLNDKMVDFDSPIVVHHNNKSQSFDKVHRSAKLIQQTLAERTDIDAVFSAEVRVKVN